VYDVSLRFQGEIIKIRTFAVACAAGLIGIAALAADLGKYKNWPKSPEGYFMTKADRAAWSGLETEADAEAFVRKFVAARGGAAFESEVAGRVKAADDHLSVAGDLASRSLRGKIVILLGPPSSFTITEKSAHNSLGTVGNAMSGIGASGSPSERGTGGGAVGLSPGDIVDAQNLSEMNTRIVHLYNFTYAKATLPNHPPQDMQFTVEVDPSTGQDRITDVRMNRIVNELLESAAEARATTK